MPHFRSTTRGRLAAGALVLAALAALAVLPPASARAATAAKTKPTGNPAQAASPPAPSWVATSNANAQLVLDVMAKFAPEQAGQMGVMGLDQEILDVKPGVDERSLAAVDQVIATLETRLAAEKDPLVRQDLEILSHAAKEQREGQMLERKLTLPYFNATQTVFLGIHALLDDQVPAERRKAALVRLNRYAGLEKGYEPFAKLAEARLRERLSDTQLIGPVKDEVEKDLANNARYIAGIEQLFKKYEIKGYEPAYAAVQQQLAGFDDFVRQSILPRARTDFRQPAELYAFGLKSVGVDMPVVELQNRAKASFQEIQSQMQALSARVAQDQGLSVTDYRDVIRELKKRQLVGDAILPHYQKRIKDIETIIARENIVTLPKREMAIRLASEAESAMIPAPNFDAPRLIGNTGEKGTFLLPLRIPGAPGQKQLQFDDFTFEAASWTLTAHEGRPGHELQFSAVVENGVSIARAIFAFNSVNVEGWGLYAESEMFPYEPADGQLITLQIRLMRAARAFLDPGLQLGTITKDEAMRVLREDVVLSEAMANQEVERYTFRSPGQATAYFVGYNRLLEIRADAQRMLGPQFDRKAFNDFVLAQVLLPPELLRKAVVETFIPARRQDQKAAR